MSSSALPKATTTSNTAQAKRRRRNLASTTSSRSNEASAESNNETSNDDPASDSDSSVPGSLAPRRRLSDTHAETTATSLGQVRLGDDDLPDLDSGDSRQGRTGAQVPSLASRLRKENSIGREREEGNSSEGTYDGDISSATASGATFRGQTTSASRGTGSTAKAHHHHAHGHGHPLGHFYSQQVAGHTRPGSDSASEASFPHSHGHGHGHGHGRSGLNSSMSSNIGIGGRPPLGGPLRSGDMADIDSPASSPAASPPLATSDAENFASIPVAIDHSNSTGGTGLGLGPDVPTGPPEVKVAVSGATPPVTGGPAGPLGTTAAGGLAVPSHLRSPTHAERHAHLQAAIHSPTRGSPNPNSHPTSPTSGTYSPAPPALGAPVLDAATSLGGATGATSPTGNKVNQAGATGGEIWTAVPHGFLSTMAAEDIQRGIRDAIEGRGESAKHRTYKIGEPPADRPVRIYADGVYDLFHFAHALQLRQAKLMFPSVYLLVGVCADELVRKHKANPILTSAERYESVRNCKWVDEVVEDAPWLVDQNFLDKHKIDYVAHDEEPYAAAGVEDAYQFVKDQGRFLPTRRTAGISTSELLERIVRGYIGGQYDNKLVKIGAPELCSRAASERGSSYMDQDRHSDRDEPDGDGIGHARGSLNTSTSESHKEAEDVDTGAEADVEDAVTTGGKEKGGEEDVVMKE